MKRSDREPERGRIPEFKSIQEEAEFWDTHDFTDYQEGFTPVRVRFAEKLSEGASLRPDAETLR